jgi:hypothetical protein
VLAVVAKIEDADDWRRVAGAKLDANAALCHSQPMRL